MLSWNMTPRFPVNRIIGWSILLVVLAAVCSASGQQGTITTNVKLRQGPGTNYPALTGVLSGASVDILEVREQWVQLRVRKSHMEFTGWVFHEFVHIVPATPAPTPSPDKKAPAPAAPAIDKSDAAEPRDSGAVTASPPGGAAPVPPADTPRAPAAASTGTAEQRPAEPPPPPPTAEAPPPPPASSGVGKDLLILVGLLSLSAIGIAYVAVNLVLEHRRKAQAEDHARRAAEIDAGVSEERRKHPRTNRLMEVDFVHEGRFYAGMINNISAAGAFIETDAHLETGDRIHMSYPELGGAGQIKREAEVVRITGGGVAVVFIPPPPADD